VLWQAIDILTHGVFVYSTTGSEFSLLSALSPWPLVYTNAGGYSLPFFINCAFWILSLLGIPLLMKKNMPAGIMTILFFIGGIVTLVVFKRPHLQYFIPLAMIGSITASIAIEKILFKLFARREKTKFSPASLALALLLSYSFFLQYRDRMMMRNDEQLQVLEEVALHIPKHEPVYDMVGSFIFRPDAFPWTTDTYYMYAYQIQPDLKPLREFLINRQVKYIVLDQKAFIFTNPPPEDLQFIITHFLPSAYFKIYTPGVSFSCKQSLCNQLNLHGNPISKQASDSFNLHISTSYHLIITPQSQSITIDGKEYQNNEIITLSLGNHTFTPPWNLTKFTLQMIDQIP